MPPWGSRRPWSRNGHGGELLWRAFWLYGVLGSALLAGALLWGHAEQPGPARAAAGVLLFAGYTAWAACRIWRSAFNAEDREWGYAARAVVVFWVLNAVLGLGFLLLDLLACGGCS